MVADVEVAASGVVDPARASAGLGDLESVTPYFTSDSGFTSTWNWRRPPPIVTTRATPGSVEQGKLADDPVGDRANLGWRRGYRLAC